MHYALAAIEKACDGDPARIRREVTENPKNKLRFAIGNGASPVDIDKFVDADKIDRLYWDHPYYLAPDGDMAAESFAVIASAMAKSKKVALGRVVMAQRERLMALEPRDGGIIATTLRDRDELRDAAKKEFARIQALFGDYQKALEKAYPKPEIAEPK